MPGHTPKLPPKEKDSGTTKKTSVQKPKPAK